MLIYAIFGQRKEDYEGQYAPELLDAIDEFGNEDNPSFIEDKLKKHKADKWLESVKLITIEVDREKIEAILRPKQDDAIKGKIVGAK